MAKALFKDLFEQAKKHNFEAFVVSETKSESTDIEYLNGKLEGFRPSIDTSYTFSAIKDGKKGSYKIDSYSKKINTEILNNLDELCKYGKEYKLEYLTSGKQKYRNLNRFDDSYKNFDLEALKNKIVDVSNKALEKYKGLLATLMFAVSYGSKQGYHCNSLGLEDCPKASTYYQVVCEVVLNDGTKTESNYDYKEDFTNIFEEDFMSLIDNVVSKAKDQLKGSQIKSGSYKIVLDHGPATSLLTFLLEHLSAKKIYDKTSLFLNDLDGKEVLSKKITITSDSKTLSSITSTRDINSRPIPHNVPIIKNGRIVNCYLDNEYGLKLGKESNSLSGCTERVKAGKKSFDETIKSINKGIYITEISSLHSSMDVSSLSFSCPFTGYLIKDGKIDQAISLSMVSGNCIQVFKDVISVLSETSDKYGMFMPKLVIKKMKIISK